MKKSEEYKKEHSELKTNIITDIFWLIKDQDEENDVDGTELDMSGKNIIVTHMISDQESEVIHRLEIRESEIIAHAGLYEDDIEYNLEEFELPILIKILESVEKTLNM